ncbi:hypothetical protein PanWU01x14_340640 [Parasponia andersonii]|uniref:Uncharacterized protein n=1 Tax=Parasponia andersonii TaxID=3476 RepID=A0A2P5AEA6_PARAD|nr:hypothetical protein PanWU01x14_340640 [Parasponia andersonii]
MWRTTGAGERRSRLQANRDGKSELWSVRRACEERKALTESLKGCEAVALPPRGGNSKKSGRSLQILLFLTLCNAIPLSSFTPNTISFFFKIFFSFSI